MEREIKGKNVCLPLRRHFKNHVWCYGSEVVENYKGGWHSETSPEEDYPTCFFFFHMEIPFQYPPLPPKLQRMMDPIWTITIFLHPALLGASPILTFYAICTSLLPLKLFFLKMGALLKLRALLASWSKSKQRDILNMRKEGRSKT